VQRRFRSLSLGELAERLGAELQGDAGVRIHGMAPLASATGEELSFLAAGRYRRHLTTTQAGAVILRRRDAAACPTATLVVADPYLSYAHAVRLLALSPPPATGIHPTAVIDASAVIADNVGIGAHSVIGRGVRVGEHAGIGPGCVLGDYSEVGARTRLVANVSLLEHVRIGDDGLIHAGVVIGADGFGFAPEQGRWLKIPQLGGVRIGDDVEIGANTTIDRGALGDTVIGNGVKIDNQVQIGHNVHIGEHSILAGGTSCAGSVTIGRHCMIGGDCSISGHLTLTDEVNLLGGSAVSRSIGQSGTYASGQAAVKVATWRRNHARLVHLDSLLKQLRNDIDTLQRERANPG